MSEMSEHRNGHQSESTATPVAAAEPGNLTELQGDLWKYAAKHRMDLRNALPWKQCEAIAVDLRCTPAGIRNAQRAIARKAGWPQPEKPAGPCAQCEAQEYELARLRKALVAEREKLGLANVGKAGALGRADEWQTRAEAAERTVEVLRSELQKQARITAEHLAEMGAQRAFDPPTGTLFAEFLAAFRGWAYSRLACAEMPASPEWALLRAGLAYERAQAQEENRG